jgi:hypothetical protein
MREKQKWLAFVDNQINSIIAWQAGQENWIILVEINRSPSFRIMFQFFCKLRA